MDAAAVKSKQHFQDNNIGRKCVNYNKEINMLMDGSVVLKINSCFNSACTSGSLGVRDSQKLAFDFQNLMPGSQ